MVRTYRVKPRVTFGPGGMYKSGDLLDLEESEAAGFLDKLQLVGPQAEQKPQTVSLKNDLNMTVPQDLTLSPEPEEAEGFTLQGQDLIPEIKQEKPTIKSMPKAKTVRKKKAG